MTLEILCSLVIVMNNQATITMNKKGDRVSSILSSLKEKVCTKWIICQLMLVWIIFTFLIYPNLNILVSTFFNNGEFSLDVIRKLLKSKRAMMALRNSFILAFSLSITVNILGIFLIFVTEYFKLKGAKFLKLAYMTPLVYGGIVLVSGYKFVYGSNGIVTQTLQKFLPNLNPEWFTGYFAVLFIMTFSCTTNHIIFLTNAFRKLDYQVIEAARNMGASGRHIIFQIILPILKPTIFAVTILTFLTGLGAVSAPLMVGGREFQTINPIIIMFAGSAYSRGIAALLSIILGLATMTLLIIMNRIEKGGNYISVSKVKSQLVKKEIENKGLNIVTHILAYLVAVINLFPMLMVVIYSFTDSKAVSSGNLSVSSFTIANYIKFFSDLSAIKPYLVSIFYSLGASIIVVVICLFVAKTIHKKDGKYVKFLEYSMLIPWMLPATLIAMGLIVTYDQPKALIFDNVLIGTPYIMIIAYVIVKIPFTFRMLRSAFYSVDSSLEEAAKVMGASPFYTFKKVVLPVIFPFVAAIMALNFNALLSDYDVSVFLYHPVLKPLGVVIRANSDAQADFEAKVMIFVYSVILMIISSIVIYFVYGRNTDKTK